MIDDGQSLIEIEIKNIKNYYGPYVPVQFCQPCKWFGHYNSLNREFCPVCGENITNGVGRFKFKEKTKGKIFKKTYTEVIGFTPRGGW